MTEWKQYQDDVADFFRGLGYTATTDVTVDGARGRHAIDVLVRFTTGGVPIVWVIECKLWARAVPKERVLVLDGVVKDLGADRGFLVAEAGYQAGAIRAAQHCNITLTSLGDLRENSEEERTHARLQNQIHRIGLLGERARRLWAWTQPRTQQPTFGVDKLLDVASSTFELQMITLPHLASRHFPVSIPLDSGRISVRTAGELEPWLEQALTEADRKLASLEHQVREASERLTVQISALDAGLNELLAAGRRLTDHIESAQADAFVAAMRSIDAVASDLRLTAPDTIVNAVTALMRHLIESTYLVTATDRPDWPTEQSSITELLGAIREGRDEVEIQHSPVLST